MSSAKKTVDKNKLKAKHGHNTKEMQRLVDVHRKRARKDGGRYVEGNVVVIDPVEHLKEHGNHREREEFIEKLKTLVDDRYQMVKYKVKLSNQLDANKRRTDTLLPESIEFYEQRLKEANSHIAKKTKAIEKLIRSSDLPIVEAALKIPCVGPMTVAVILAYVDIKKARYASSLWAYAGLHKPSYQRRDKNKDNQDGHMVLRNALFTMAESFWKGKTKYRNAYVEIWENEKLKLEASQKITKTRLAGKQGIYEKKWCDVSPGHRHSAGRRKMIKHFLADMWKVWRTLEGLDTPMLYPEAKLGHKGIVTPEERGWVY